jgi:prophage maintenance system killer protein
MHRNQHATRAGKQDIKEHNTEKLRAVVLNLAEAAHELHRLVKAGEFRLAKEIADNLQYLIARDEALESGGQNLRLIFAHGVQFIREDVDSIFEQAIAYFLFAALQQFYFDGNKRTARYMMNGHLMAHGFDAISVRAARRQEFNTSMVEFFMTKNGTGMFRFPASCREEADRGVLPGGTD